MIGHNMSGARQVGCTTPMAFSKKSLLAPRVHRTPTNECDQQLWGEPPQIFRVGAHVGPFDRPHSTGFVAGLSDLQGSELAHEG